MLSITGIHKENVLAALFLALFLFSFLDVRHKPSAALDLALG
jgi:hypothetical protein